MIHEQASAVLSAIRTIENEGQGLEALAAAVRTAGEGGLGSAFSQAVERIAAASGRVWKPVYWALVTTVVGEIG